MLQSLQELLALDLMLVGLVLVPYFCKLQFGNSNALLGLQVLSLLFWYLHRGKVYFGVFTGFFV